MVTLGSEFLKDITKRFSVFVHTANARTKSPTDADADAVAMAGADAEQEPEAAAAAIFRVLLFGAKEQISQAKNVIVEQLNDLKVLRCAHRATRTRVFCCF